MKLLNLRFILPSVLLCCIAAFGHAQIDTAFIIPQKDLIPEGLAYNPKDNTFYLSSINKHKIVKIYPNGRTTDFTRQDQDGLGEVLGLRVDSARQQLWVCSNDQQENHEKSMLHHYDLATGKLLEKYEVIGRGHLFNDVVCGADGSVFVTDSDGQSIYQVFDHTLSLFLSDDRLRYCNGLTFMEDETTLLISSFNGLYRLNITSKELAIVRMPGYHVSGLDGLYRFKNALIGIQNTSFPESINLYELNETSKQITSATNLVSQHPALDMMTTGAIAQGWFYFIANSQLSNFEHGKIVHPEKLRDVVILKIKLPAVQSIK